MKRLTSLFMLMFVMIMIPIQVFAVDYSIEEMNIDAELQENGNVLVTEKQRYKFDGKFSGFIRTLIPKEGTDISQVKAEENGAALKVEQDENEYKIYRKGKDETVVFELTYLIEKGVDVYSDVADFSWAFFDTGNESDYEKFTATIHPPAETTDVIAYGTDTAFETEKVQANGAVQFNLGHVPSGKKGNVRVAYDASLFPAAEITEDTFMRDVIETEKQELVDQHKVFEENKNRLSSFAPYLIGLLFVLFASMLFYIWQKRQAIIKEVNRKFTTPYFVPEEVMSLPATITYMNHHLINPETLSAALMDLVRKGYVEEQAENTFKVINRKTDHAHEAMLINWLFDEVGKEGIFKVDDLKTYTALKKNQDTYQKSYSTWQKSVQEEISQSGLLSKNKKARFMFGLIGLLIIPLIIYLAIYELFMYMTLAIILAIGFLLFALFYKTRTVLGTKVKRDWQSFQDKYPEMAESEWQKLETDDQKRAFIYGIGIKDKKIDKKNKRLMESFSTENYMTSPANMLFLAAIVSSNFTQAESTSAASSSTGPGAGTGVGGGGGGSGAF